MMVDLDLDPMISQCCNFKPGWREVQNLVLPNSGGEIHHIIPASYHQIIIE